MGVFTSMELQISIFENEKWNFYLDKSWNFEKLFNDYL